MVRQSPRRRGRPIGDGIDDTAVLVEAARRILASTAEGRGLRPTTAMKLAGCRTDESTLRRLQRKWLDRSSVYLAAARPERPVAPMPHRHREVPSRITTTSMPTATSALQRAHADLAMYGMFGTPRRAETRIEREIRVTSQRMHDLASGRTSEEEGIMRDAACPNLAIAFREARLGIDRVMRTVMGCGTTEAAFRGAWAGR